MDLDENRGPYLPTLPAARYSGVEGRITNEVEQLIKRELAGTTEEF
jgi:hypothetical protein